MIVSNSRKYIFVHVLKAAGTSITRALEPSLQWNDLVLGSTVLGESIQTPYRRQFNLHKHSRAAEIRQVVGEAIWDEYFTFTFVRHPYDRAISLYTWIERLVESQPLRRYLPLKSLRKREFWSYPGTRAYLETGSFSEFIRHPKLLQSARGFELQTEWVVDSRGETIVDYIGRYESIKDDFDAIVRKISVQPIQLGFHNQSRGLTSIRPRVATSDLELLHDHFRQDFDMLGYDPDPERFLSERSG